MLEAVDEGRIRRLIITMPPRHGKSEKVSVRFPAWYLGRHPDRRVVVASYASDLALKFSRQVRATVDSEKFGRVFPGITLNPLSRSAENWDLDGYRGGMKAVGVGGPLTGHGANLLIIDDPLKNREEANSEVVRQSVWDWYTSTAYTRLEDSGAIVVVMTRWHEDDLVGRLLAAEDASADADQWHVLRMPALSDDGVALWPEKYTADDLASIRANIGEYDWHALYQGQPRPREGAMFKTGRIEFVDAVPVLARRCRGWDKASTAGGGDFTAGVLMAEHQGLWYIEDVVHGQWDSSLRDGKIRHTAETDGLNVKVWGEQEPGSGGKDAAGAFVRLLSGYSVSVAPSTTRKEARADAFSSQVNAGNVRIKRGTWNKRFLDELASFPMGRHDDMVDAASGAFNHLAAAPAPQGAPVIGGQRAAVTGFKPR